MEKISVGALDEKQKMSGIYFDDKQFMGLPTKLRVPFDHWKPRGQFDKAIGGYVPNTLVKVDLSAWNEDAIQFAMTAPDPAMRAASLGSVKLMNIWVNIPSEKDYPKDFAKLQKVVNDISDKFEQNGEKDLLLTDCVCHVIPLGADYGNFKGMQLAIYNLANAKVSFVDPVK